MPARKRVKPNRAKEAAMSWLYGQIRQTIPGIGTPTSIFGLRNELVIVPTPVMFSFCSILSISKVVAVGIAPKV